MQLNYTNTDITSDHQHVLVCIESAIYHALEDLGLNNAKSSDLIQTEVIPENYSFARLEELLRDKSAVKNIDLIMVAIINGMMSYQHKLALCGGIPKPSQL